MDWGKTVGVEGGKKVGVEGEKKWGEGGKEGGGGTWLVRKSVSSQEHQVLGTKQKRSFCRQGF